MSKRVGDVVGLCGSTLPSAVHDVRREMGVPRTARVAAQVCFKVLAGHASLPSRAERQRWPAALWERSA